MRGIKLMKYMDLKGNLGYTVSSVPKKKPAKKFESGDIHTYVLK